jgi:hypothetical protein
MDMLKETSNDMVEICDRLNKSPFSEKRIPSNERISIIQNSVKGGQRRNNKPLWIVVGAVLVSLIIFFTLAYVNEMPGGYADWRMSQAIGLEGTNIIPLGRTPEEALQKLRHYPFMEIVHEEPVNGGTLLFIKRYYQKDGTDLEIAYLRKTWFGWKWTWGGMFGSGGSLGGTKSVLSYMVMPRVKGINTPFPMIYGDILDPSVNNIIIVEKGGSNPGKYSAKIAGSKTGHTVWFAYLPTSSTVPYEIQALNVNGVIVASKIVNEPQDSGQVKSLIK